MYQKTYTPPKPSMFATEATGRTWIEKDDSIRRNLAENFMTLQYHIDNELCVSRVCIEDFAFDNNSGEYKYINAIYDTEKRFNLTPVFTLGSLVHREIHQTLSDAVSEQDSLSIDFLGSITYAKFIDESMVTVCTYRLRIPSSMGDEKQTFIVTDTYNTIVGESKLSLVSMGLL